MSRDFSETGDISRGEKNPSEISLPPLIGLTGKARAGKDSVAFALSAVAGYKRVALADPLKEMALAIDPLVGRRYHLTDVVEVEGWEGAKEVPEVRRFLQRLGTEGVRGTFGAGAWIALLAARIEGTDNPVVVTDVRFPNEAKWVRDAGGVVWRIERPTSGAGGNADHASERVDGIEVDVVIRNDGTLADLADAVHAALGIDDGP